MNKTSAVRPRIRPPSLRALCFAGSFWVAACGGSNDQLTLAEPSVCPDCPELAGGESSDFGGTPHPCAQFEQRELIDRVQAAALGFDVGLLEQRVERELDEPMLWMPQPLVLGDPAAGYDEETRVQGNARITSYTHVALDPDACDGMTCRVALTEEMMVCADRLEVGIHAELRTLDGAVTAEVNGYGLYGRAGFPFSETPAGSMFANLRDVSGTLQLFPLENYAVKRGLLLVDLFFGADRTRGNMTPAMWIGIAGGGPAYSPLFGNWLGTSLNCDSGGTRDTATTPCPPTVPDDQL